MRIRKIKEIIIYHWLIQSMELLLINLITNKLNILKQR